MPYKRERGQLRKIIDQKIYSSSKDKRWVVGEREREKTNS